MLPPHGGAGESCTPRCRVKTLILSSQNYSPTSGMPLHLRWSRRNHTAERRRLLTKQTGKGTTKSVEPLLVQTSETSNKSRTSPDTAELALSQTNLTENSTISISSIVTVSVHNCFPETPIGTAPVQTSENSYKTGLSPTAEPVLSQTTVTDCRTMWMLSIETKPIYTSFPDISIETAPVQASENSHDTSSSPTAELALSQITSTDCRTISNSSIETVFVYSSFHGTSLTRNFSTSKSYDMSDEKKPGDKRPLEEDLEEGESLDAAHTQYTPTKFFCAFPNPIALRVNLTSPGMEVEDEMERKRTREESEDGEQEENLLVSGNEKGKPAAKLSRQERADYLFQEHIAHGSNLRQRNLRALPRVLFVLQLGANTFPAFYLTPVQSNSRRSSLGSAEAQASVEADEEAELLNGDGEGTEKDGSRSKKRRRTPFNQLNPEQQARRKETVRLKNLRKKERRKQAKLSAETPATESSAKTGAAPDPSNQPGPSGLNQPDRASLPTQRSTTSSKRSKSDKGKEKRPADLPCSNPTKILIKKKDGGVCTKADFALIQRSFIRARLDRAREAGGSALPVQIRDSRLVNGRVEVTVWDRPSEEFVVGAVGGLEEFVAETGEGTATFVFTLPVFWHYEDPNDLITILQADNPALPSGAITFLSWTERGRDGRRVYVGVTRAGIAVLRDLGFSLKTLFGTLKLSPAAH